MKVRVVMVRPAPPRGYLVQWSLKDPPVGAVTFTVERSGGPGGPWEPVTANAVNQYAFFDPLPQPVDTDPAEVLRLNQFRFFQAVYYRVTATHGGSTSSDVFELGPQARGKISGMRRKAARDVRVALVKFSKMPCVLLKKRVWGPRCPICYDPRTKAVTRGGCKTCYGTSFEGGFWAPVPFPARRQGGEAAAVTGQPKSDVRKFHLVAPDFPKVDEGDVVVSLRTADRYRIDAETSSDLQDEPMYQSFTVTVLDRSDVVYQFHVDPTSVNPFF